PRGIKIAHLSSCCFASIIEKLTKELFFVNLGPVIVHPKFAVIARNRYHLWLVAVVCKRLKMKKVLFILLGTVLLLTGALTFRTIRFVSRQIEVPPEKMIRLDTQSIVGRLARAIQYRTISGQDTPNSTGGEFQSFHRFLDESFPGV